MSVTVKRAAPAPPPPIKSISAGANHWNDSIAIVEFWRCFNYEGAPTLRVPTLHVCTRRVDGPRIGPIAHLEAADARALAAALIEWADSVDPA
jgi:hypothetical protein